MRIGFGLLAIGALLAAVAWQLQSTIAWSAAALSIAGGLFSLLEAKLGWCAARAAGFRVPY